MTKKLLFIVFFFSLISSCKCGNNNPEQTATSAANNDTASQNMAADRADSTGTANATGTVNGNMQNTVTGGNTTANSSAAENNNTRHRLYKKHGKAGRQVSKYPGEFPEGSERILTNADVDYLSPWGLKVMLNEIYARHGMIFNDTELTQYFKSQHWYHGTSANVSNKLTPVEKQNVNFTMNYQYTPAIPAGY